MRLARESVIFCYRKVGTAVPTDKIDTAVSTDKTEASVRTDESALVYRKC